MITIISKKWYVEPDMTNKLLSLGGDHLFQIKDARQPQFQAAKVFHLYDGLPFFGDSSKRPPARILAACNFLQDHRPDLSRYAKPMHAIFHRCGEKQG